MASSAAMAAAVGAEGKPEEVARQTVTITQNNQYGHFTLTSAGPDSFDAYVDTLSALPLKDGYPAEEKAESIFKAQNIDRQSNGNVFHLYKVSCQAEDGIAELPLGFVQFGRMPSKGYGEEGGKHLPIIKKWISLGITQQIDPTPSLENPEGSLADVNIARTENRGLAMILPLFDVRADENQRKGIIDASFQLVRQFSESPLPFEKTLPHTAVSLFHPTDPNVGYFAANGFEVDANEGFGWFYPKEGVAQPRTMVTRVINPVVQDAAQAADLSDLSLKD